MIHPRLARVMCSRTAPVRFWGKADRTLSDCGAKRPLSQVVGITTCTANYPSGHASSCDQGQPPRHPIRGPIQGRPTQGPSRRHRDSALVPSGHASSVAPIARPSYYRCPRWQPQVAGGSVRLGSFRSRPQKPDPQFRSRIVCATFVFTHFPWLIGPSSRSLERRTTDQLNNGTAVP